MKIAIDLTFAAGIALARDNVVGISRAALETARALAARETLELTCVGWSDPDPVMASARVRRWARATGLPVEATPPTRIRLDRAYEAIAVGLNRRPLISTLSRVGLAALKRCDAPPISGDRLYDVYHSTFLPLPPQSRSSARACVVTIYDVIPFTDPTATVDAQRQTLEAILSSIDVDRDVIIAISEHTKCEVCERLSIDPGRVVVAPLAAASQFRPAPFDRSATWLPSPVRSGAHFVLSVAASQPRKNLAHLVRAFGRVIEDQPAMNLQLILTGSLSCGDDVQDQLDATPGLSARVHRLGFVPDSQLAQLYAGAQAFVFPSRAEGFGLPALEAMQSGAPTVVSRAGALPEVVADGAIVVDPDDLDELTEVLGHLASDEALRRRLSSVGRARASEFSWDRCGAATERAYRLACGQ